MKLHNKKMLISLISIATVALGSVGFATWIIGVQKKTTDVGNLKVETDDVKNNSIFLTATLPKGASIAFGETTDKVENGKLANLDQYLKKDKAMKFDFASIQYKVGTEVKTKPAKLKMELVTSITKNASNYVNEDKNKFNNIRTGENFQYVYYYEVIDLNSEANGNVTVDRTDPNIETYTFKDTALKNHTFKWGTFFGNNWSNGVLEGTDAKEYSPLTYYNEVICEDVSDNNFETLTDYASKATAEIKQMKQDLETPGTTFTITLTLLDSKGTAL